MALDQASGQETNRADPATVVHGIVEEVAGVDVRPDESFFDLGLDSIQLMQVCNRINEEFGEVIDLFLLFENPTVNECVSVISAQRSG
ncbi:MULTISPECIES: acyl carrier protein [Micromonospora]|uniref:acyl carrier protein n=1 Tax=Micromonospora TaxID=1873 RepID=UPI00110317FF|nr:MULTISPECIES: acyl carrier protein [unclassified Micromonospora]MBF5030001.1 acyl carrier protein [Micromonospora sp. ANENR4]MBU8860482.1 acyl carrier protein [Micromonospora sp. WMMB482]MCZ7474973.1 acyl carrier protein [Micromonospora sp. WMMC273]MDM4780019.1 acyl carrier protein [Micromonospora sp. b486]MDW3849328.1 acyl carrier protein [Micromonospora sp. BRA006-A]